MTARKAERLMNLTICLLVARTYITKDRIRQAVDGYHDLTDEAFDRMFDRDKDELRVLGIPIELGSVVRGFDDEVGYRIHRDQFELPEITLEADEAAVRSVALEAVAEVLAGREPRKVIVVPGRLVSVVV